jgi:hypothetical protein
VRSAYRTTLRILGIVCCASAFVAFAQSAQLSLGSATTTAAGSVVPLGLSFTPSNTGAAGLQWQLVYSPNSVVNVSATLGSAGAAAGKSLYCNAGLGTYLCLLAGPNTDNIGAGVLATVNVALGPAVSTASVTISSAFGVTSLGDGVAVASTGGTINVVPSGTATPKYLSDLSWTSMTNGWGPVEKDRSNGEQATADGRTLSIRGVTYAKGLGTHAASNVQYSLTAAGSCTAFAADVGVDDETNGFGSAVFQVWADGTKLYDSGLMTGTTAARSVTADITGKSLLSLLVNDSGDGSGSDHADWANARLTCAAVSTPAATTPQTRYLSGLTWSSMTNGWGPVEKDRSNGEQATGDGRTLSIRGVTYAKGLGSHAVSNVQYSLAAADSCTAFGSDIGIDDEANGLGSVVFQVWADGTELYDSGLVTGAMAAKSVTVDVTGKSLLSLLVNDGGDGNSNDHADWANARLTCGAVSTPAATTLQTKYLSDLVWTSMTNGWGSVEKDRSNGEQATGDGRILSIRGVTYAKGLGTHAASNVQYSLTAAGACTAFAADVGIDDEASSLGSVIFQVWADGIKLYDSGLVTGTMAAKSATVDLTGKSLLSLLVNDGGDGNGNDHADWANARLTCQ